ncbi:MAG TPA: ATP-dependent helicase [Candidatus Sulfobium mesophilum]|nr:ATP-dependent helicase [Candidatus Sulfobium mesophilum]
MKRVSVKISSMKKYRLHREPSSFIVDYEKDLNPEQYSAVMHEKGPALVLAGAGTGKTRVVTYRVARLIEAGTRPENILLLTFTNKAAREMMRRVEKLAGRNIIGLFGGTFHHIANLILRQHYPLAGYKQGFSILDREDSKELFEACISEVHKKDIVLPRGAVFSEINSMSKNTGHPVGDIVKERFSHFVAALDDIEKIINLYESKKVSLNLLDFDDLLVKWKYIFEQHDRIREYYSLKFRYILVDEYQDTNRLQADIIDLATGDDKNLMVVGDDAQSIYSFRGADFENILRFPQRYSDASIFKLTINYRSTPEILYLANRIIANNMRQFAKDLRAVVPSGEAPNVVPLKDIFEEAEFVASVIMDMNSDGKSFDQIAVLYRSHYQSMQLQMELQRRGIPFEIRSGLKFFEQAHIKDVLSYLRIMVNPFDEISWMRTLKLIRGIGNITSRKIWEFIGASADPAASVSEAYRLIPRKAADGFGRFLDLLRELREEKYHSTPSAAIDYIISHGYEDHLYNNYPNAEMRIEDIQQMSRFSQRYDSLDTFLSDLALQGVTDAETEETELPGGKVVLSTVHQAKGLEWEAVFIIGMNDGRFPSAKSLRSDDEEEERRLFYVGVTRAREDLYVCYPISSEDWNALGFLRPSRFLKELPKDCFEEIAVEDV